MLIVFDHAIVNMVANKKLSPMVTEMFLRQLKVSMVSLSKSYSGVSMNIKSNEDIFMLIERCSFAIT